MDVTRKVRKKLRQILNWDKIIFLRIVDLKKILFFFRIYKSTNRTVKTVFGVTIICRMILIVTKQTLGRIALKAVKSARMTKIGM